MSKGCDPSLPSCPQERLESLTKGATGAQAGEAKGSTPIVLMIPGVDHHGR